MNQIEEDVKLVWFRKKFLDTLVIREPLIHFHDFMGLPSPYNRLLHPLSRSTRTLLINTRMLPEEHEGNINVIYPSLKNA